ncbi:DNA polymerase zeta catalytic subunit-like [Gossypium australe]|uniref:DNA polymerase zeta catalytic subunit-like n=1 Tax=Gossypium australe TaxID=47621 RepID=A0A5B6VB86_9ROSI|nr:DNA polymerase zeta catalytic subunit-like [Gossypium australe]
MKDSIKSEIDSIMQNHVWELVNLPPRIKPLNSKWIFKWKMKADGTIDKYKAELVIKVSRITSIGMILTVAALRNLEVHHIDAKTTFLNGDLDEQIYMEQLEGHVVLGQ